METDRINHFFWDEKDDIHGPYHKPFFNFYKKIGDFLKELNDKSDEYQLIVLSDHGFTHVKKDVNLDVWMRTKGYLSYKSGTSKGIDDIDHAKTTAYNLIPGRIFANMKGREENGIVQGNTMKEKVLSHLLEELIEFKDPDTNQLIIDKIFLAPQIYDGPYISESADMIIHPNDGYDLKMGIQKNTLFTKGAIGGMHTYNDAFFYIKNQELSTQDISIVDIAPTILDFFGLKDPDMDGRIITSEK